MKKIAKIILLAEIILCSNKLYAQNITIGTYGGINIPSLVGGGSDKPTYAGNSLRYGADFGLYGGYQVARSLSLSIGIENSSQGGIYQLHYLLVPILARKSWKIDDSWQFYAGAGPFGGLLLDANRETSPGIIKNPNRINIGITGMAGISCQVSKRSSLFFEVGSLYGYIRVQKPSSHAKGHLFNDGVKVGYAYTFKKRYKNKYHPRPQRIHVTD